MNERLRITGTPHEGVKTGERGELPLPSLVGGEVRYLPPYIEITTDEGVQLQAHPKNIELAENVVIILPDPLAR